MRESLEIKKGVNATIRFKHFDSLCHRFAAFFVRDVKRLRVVSIRVGDGLVSREGKNGLITEESTVYQRQK